MKKIGFLVQTDFLTNHFGVRNFFSSIANACAGKYQVDYLIHNCTTEGIYWYICDVLTPSIKESPKIKGIEFDMAKYANYLKYADCMKYIEDNRIGKSLPNMYYRSVGGSLLQENYDLLVITNPWLVDFDMPLPSRKVIGIVHDLVPNQYSLTKQTFNFDFAHQHQRGYQYYNCYCDEIYANSEETSRQYNIYYNTNRCKFFPPFPPYAFKDAHYNGVEKENSIILAAPFDVRKGIEDMPSLLNGAKDLIDMLYIYGMPRCTEEIFNTFFKSLKIKRITYYPYIDDDDLISLYQRSKILLFPSKDEGLGIPIIEAQVCGCRVVTTDKSPMNQLICSGAYLLDTDSEEKNVSHLRKMMTENYSYKTLSTDAAKKFSYGPILDIITEIVNQ